MDTFFQIFKISYKSLWCSKSLTGVIVMKLEPKPVLMSFQLSSLCSQDNSQVTRQKTCRLIAAAASLQVARTSIDQQEQVSESRVKLV